MNKSILLFASLLTVGVLLSGCESCGYTSVNNELTGQVKKVKHNTPIICPDYVGTDISLGVMRNGVGSMSAQDVWMTVVNPSDVKLLEEAAATGQLVKIKYRERRVTWCIEDDIVDSVALLDNEAKSPNGTETVELKLNGHQITATITNGAVVSLKLDGTDTPLDSSAGKAAIRVIEATR